MHNPDEILAVLDRCCDAFTFPMMDNGYVYPAATRLTLFRSAVDWAMAIEVFGHSPRAGSPDVCIQTFASRLHNRNSPESWATREAYENYLANNPHNEMRGVFPINDGPWQDPEGYELVSEDAVAVTLRGIVTPIPKLDEYARHGIELVESPQVHVFELCRYLAAIRRDQVLSTPEELRVSVRPELDPILQLDEWHHPDLADDERTSTNETFRQLAQVLATGDIRHYKPTLPPNTHWRNWPNAGVL